MRRRAQGVGLVLAVLVGFVVHGATGELVEARELSSRRGTLRSAEVGEATSALPGAGIPDVSKPARAAVPGLLSDAGRRDAPALHLVSSGLEPSPIRRRVFVASRDEAVGSSDGDPPQSTLRT